MEQLIQTLVERLIEQTVRSVKAEYAIEGYLKQIDEMLEQLEKAKKSLADLQQEYDTTEGAYRYKNNECIKLKAEKDALEKEVEQLKAKLNTSEGLEASDRGLL